MAIRAAPFLGMLVASALLVVSTRATPFPGCLGGTLQGCPGVQNCTVQYIVQNVSGNENHLVFMIVHVSVRKEITTCLLGGPAPVVARPRYFVAGDGSVVLFLGRFVNRIMLSTLSVCLVESCHALTRRSSPLRCLSRWLQIDHFSWAPPLGNGRHQTFKCVSFCESLLFLGYCHCSCFLFV